MRTQPLLRRFIAVLAIALWLACVATNVVAQKTQQETPVAGQDGRAVSTPAPTYDLEIKDGLLIWSGAKRKDHASQVPANLGNVIDLLRELHPEANFVVAPELAENAIADLKMRSAGVEEELEAIRIASGSEFFWRNAPATRIDPKTGLPLTPGDQPGPPLYVLERAPAEAKPGLQVDVEAFNIGTYLNSFNTSSGKGTEEELQKRLLQIERMALETVKEYEVVSRTLNKSTAKSLRPPSIRFHPGANLAIIIGEPEAVAVAAKVIGALPGAQRSVASDPTGSGDPSQKVDDVIKRLQRDGALPSPRR